MSAVQFSTKRRFINGQNDWHYQDTKAPVTTSADQYIYGVKQFADPVKALNDVMCSGFYYGDGSNLINLPGDPTKLPLAGGTMTGNLDMQDSNINLFQGQTQIQLASSILMSNSGPPFCDLFVDAVGGFGVTEYGGPPKNCTLNNATGLSVVNDTLQSSLIGSSLTMQDVTTGVNAVLNRDVLSFTNAAASNFALCRIGTDSGALNGMQARSNVYSGNESEVFLGFEFNVETGKLRIRQGMTKEEVVITADTFSMVNEDALKPYFFTNNNVFVKWDTGTSFRIDLNDQSVQKYHSFKVSGGNDFFLGPFNEYLDSNQNGGWSVILSNPENFDIIIFSSDLYFYSHATGIQVASIQLKKWATARVTLVPTNNTDYGGFGFAWAVSMY